MLPLSESLIYFVLSRLYLLLIFCCKTTLFFDYKWGRACTAACESTHAIYTCKYIYALITTFPGETSRFKYVSFLLQVRQHYASNEANVIIYEGMIVTVRMPCEVVR